MNVYPESGLAKLGFDVIHDRIREYLKTEQGLIAAERLELTSNVEEIRRHLVIADQLRTAIQFDDAVPLGEVADITDSLAAIGPEGSFLDGQDLLEIRRLAVTVTNLADYFESRIEKYPDVTALFSVVHIDRSLAVNLGDKLDADGNVADNASPELRRIRKAREGYQRELQKALARELSRARDAGYAADGQPTIRGGRHVIPVKVEGKRKVSGFIHDVSATGQTVFIEPSSCLDLNNELRTLDAAERAEVIRILSRLTDEVRENSSALTAASRVIALFDVYYAKALLARSLGGEVPSIAEGRSMKLINARNPLLQLYFAEGAEPRSVVPLDLDMGEARTLVISGPNAGGKTVAIKTVGLVLLMLAAGIPVPMDPQSSVYIPARLYVDIGDEQSIEEDLSSYSSHLALMKKVVSEADESSVVLIDEIGAATDPDQGSSMALATLEALNAKGCTTIVTTHFGRLKVAAESADGFDNASMEFDTEKLEPTYRFVQGLPGSSYAMEIATRVGLQSDLIRRARDILGNRESTVDELIARLEIEKAEIDRLRHQLEVDTAAADKAKRLYENRLEGHKAEAEKIRQQAVAESQNLLRESRAQIERTIRIIKETSADKKATRKSREKLEEFTRKVERKADKQHRSLRKPADDVNEPIAVGDFVIVDSGSAAAEVVEVKGKKLTIMAGLGKMTVERSRVRKVGGPRKQRVEFRAPKSESGLAVTSAKQRIDLRGNRVDEALGTVQTFIDDAVASNLNEVYILHGTGTGALRNAIRDYLKRRKDVVSFADAEWDAGGAGVTVVQL